MPLDVWDIHVIIDEETGQSGYVKTLMLLADC